MMAVGAWLVLRGCGVGRDGAVGED
jgi:hypothetical protein